MTKEAARSRGRRCGRREIRAVARVQGALVDEAMALSPRWIFVGFYAGNDLADTYKSVYDSAVFAELRSRDAAVLARLDASAGSGDLSDAWRATKTARKGRLKVTFTRWIGEPIRSGSRIYGLIRGLTRLGAGPISLRQDTDHTRFDKYAAVVENADPNLLFALSAGAVSTVLTPAARHAAPRDTPRATSISPKSHPQPWRIPGFSFPPGAL